jgi:hypothetical protein
MKTAWKSVSLALITGAGVSVDDAPWVLECIDKRVDETDGLNDAEKFEYLTDYFQANSIGDLCGLDAETFSDVLACLGVNLPRLQDAWERAQPRDFDQPENDWSIE